MGSVAGSECDWLGMMFDDVVPAAAAAAAKPAPTVCLLPSPLAHTPVSLSYTVPRNIHQPPLGHVLSHRAAEEGDAALTPPAAAVAPWNRSGAPPASASLRRPRAATSPGTSRSPAFANAFPDISDRVGGQEEAAPLERAAVTSF